MFQEMQDPNLPATELLLASGESPVETYWGSFEVAEYYSNVGNALVGMDGAQDQLFLIRTLLLNVDQPYAHYLARNAKVQGANIGTGMILFGQCESHGIWIGHIGVDVVRLVSMARLKEPVLRYFDKIRISEALGRCAIIGGHHGHVMHGKIIRTEDPITIEPATHDCHGVRTTTLAMYFIEIDRMLLCPCAP